MFLTIAVVPAVYTTALHFTYFPGLCCDAKVNKKAAVIQCVIKNRELSAYTRKEGHDQHADAVDHTD